jgi:multiple sugar transport system substrate-binding protein
MAFRKDLFEEEGIKGPPKTWDEFADYARRLTKDTDNDGEIDQFGVVLHFGGIDSGFTEWIVRIAGYPRPAGEDKYILNAENTKTIFGDQEYSVRALEMYKELIPYAPPGSIGYDYPEATELFNQGKAAMFITWQVLLFESEVPDKSTVAGKLGYSPPPIFTERNNYVGGWQLAIPKNTKYPEEAYKFMAWVVSEEGQELMLEAGSPTAYRKKALSDPKWIKEHPVMGAMGELNPIPLPVVEQFVEMQYTIFENLGLAVADKITPEEAIERAAKEVDAILAE